MKAIVFLWTLSTMLLNSELSLFSHLHAPPPPPPPPPILPVPNKPYQWFQCGRWPCLLTYLLGAQELCESRGGRPRLSVLTIILRFPWTKAITTITITNINPSGKTEANCDPLCWTPTAQSVMHWSQHVPNMSTDIREHEATQQQLVCLFVIVNVFV